MSIPTPTLLDRFCRYVRVHTEAVEGAPTYPSSPGQLELGRILLGELRELRRLMPPRKTSVPEQGASIHELNEPKHRQTG